jgi:RHH-type proline utilization regulon transcriptional repressor/proline dehydrogenase/delta 1-pyrroline-5-carboxylate dehydrogenase
VLAKPAEQTPVIAHEAVKLFHAAGLPVEALHLLTGDGRVGGKLTGDPRCGGVAFTGSTEVARIINRTLAAKDGPIAPLIAETGGLNALFCDTTALKEQVVDDVIMSGFRSAGQRCSALRVLFLPHETADDIIEMIKGAMDVLIIGDPADPSTDVGPIIDAEARKLLDDHLAKMIAAGFAVHQRNIGALRERGHVLRTRDRGTAEPVAHRQGNLRTDPPRHPLRPGRYRDRSAALFRRKAMG